MSKLLGTGTVTEVDRQRRRMHRWNPKPTGAGSPRVVIDTQRTVWDQLQKHYLQVYYPTGSYDREIGERMGILVGTANEGFDPGTWIITIKGFEEIEAKATGATHAAMEARAMHEAYQRAKARMGAEAIVGWYHTHPHLPLFLSDPDLQTYRQVFPDGFQVALVFDPSRWVGAWFYREQNGAIDHTEGDWREFSITENMTTSATKSTGARISEAVATSSPPPDEPRVELTPLIEPMMPTAESQKTIAELAPFNPLAPIAPTKTQSFPSPRTTSSATTDPKAAGQPAKPAQGLGAAPVQEVFDERSTRVEIRPEEVSGSRRSMKRPSGPETPAAPVTPVATKKKPNPRRKLFMAAGALLLVVALLLAISKLLGGKQPDPVVEVHPDAGPAVATRPSIEFTLPAANDTQHFTLSGTASKKGDAALALLRTALSDPALKREGEPQFDITVQDETFTATPKLESSGPMTDWVTLNIPARNDGDLHCIKIVVQMESKNEGGPAKVTMKCDLASKDTPGPARGLKIAQARFMASEVSYWFATENEARQAQRLIVDQNSKKLGIEDGDATSPHVDRDIRLYEGPSSSPKLKKGESLYRVRATDPEAMIVDCARRSCLVRGDVVKQAASSPPKEKNWIQCTAAVSAVCIK